MFSIDALSLPAADTYWVRRARVPKVFLSDPPADAEVDPDGCPQVDLRIERGRIAAIAAATAAAAADPQVEVCHRHVWPTLVDAHTHLDKSQVISRIGPLGASFASAREAIDADRAKHWSRDDLRARMEFSVRCAYFHGVSAIRTHIDSYEGQAEPSWSAFGELSRAWSGRIALQATTSVPIDVYATGYGRKLADLAAATEGGLLGGVLRRSSDHDYAFIDDIDALLDVQFALAKARNLSIDLHVDETLDARVFHLEHVARAVIRNGMQGRVVCSHCCSLAVQPDPRIEQVLALCADAGIGIITLPSANLHLQDRKLGRTPRLRGVAPVHEIRARNIPVAIASDNVRDSFVPFGDHDMVENFRHSVSLYHLDQCLADALAMVGPLPAAMIGVSPLGSLRVGGPANFIIFNARSLNEIICRPQATRIVVIGGRQLRETLPEFSGGDI